MKKWSLYIIAFLTCMSMPVLADEVVSKPETMTLNKTDSRVQEYLDKSFVYQNCKKVVDTADFPNSLCYISIVSVISGIGLTSANRPMSVPCSHEISDFINQGQGRFCLESQLWKKIKIKEDLYDAIAVFAKKYIKLIEGRSYEEWETTSRADQYMQVTTSTFGSDMTTVLSCDVSKTEIK